MRKQIAAANWKMNLTSVEASQLLNELLATPHTLQAHQEAIFAVPAIYIPLAVEKLANQSNVFVAAQNCHQKSTGAYTGEISAPMLASVGVKHIVLGHSERREYFAESDALLAEKLNAVLAIDSTPIFCCGEPLAIREAGTQNVFVEAQLKNGLFHLTAAQIVKVVIAYEPIWAIGTGKVASAHLAQDMHRAIRLQLAEFDEDVASHVGILYGGSVKSDNAVELFAMPDIDGGLIGGASLSPQDFLAICQA